MDVNFEYYKIFYYAAKYGNFTKAANVLKNSQPNITRAMNCLEHELGCRLFIRNNRGIRLTPEGERLYSHVAAAILQLQTGEEEIAANTSLESGSISIGASETALNIYLLEQLRNFHTKYPKIRLKIYNHSTPQAIQSVKSGEIDFAVVTTPTNAQSPLKEIVLMPFKEILIGGASFASLRNQELSLSDLTSYPFICLGSESMTRRFYDKLFSSYGLELSPDTEVATTDQILPLVKSDLGLAFIPDLMASEALASRSIVQIKLNERIPERNVCMVYDAGHPLSIASKELKNMIAGVA